jgi:putative transposase
MESLEVQPITETLLIDYNEQRPHDAFGGVPPLTYLPRASNAPKSSFNLFA